MKKLFKSTKIIIILIIGILLYIQFNIARWNKHEIFEWDTKVYYGYLPAVFIYNDLHLKYFDTIPELANYAWYSTDTNGNRYFKVSMEQAFMYLPSFTVVHLWQLISGGNTDGYSIPYQRAVSINALLFLFIGLFFIYKLLSLYYKSFIASITLILIVFGTNILYYASNEPGLTHVYSFTLFAVWIWLVVRWHERQRLKTALLLGFILGLIVLIRPSNIIIVIVLFFYNVNNIKGFKQNIVLFLRTYYHWLAAAVLFFLVWLPQLLYWKAVTGSYFFYTYGDESFFFSKPEIINVLFSYRKGWFVYTPIALIAIIGIIFLKGHEKRLRTSIVLYLILQIYIVASWWCWWYGGCFGQRSMIESLALLSLPLAGIVNKILEKYTWHRIAVGVVILLLFALNIIQTFQYRYTIIHWDSMTKGAYWRVFLKLDKPKDIDLYLDEPDYEKRKKGEDI